MRLILVLPLAASQGAQAGLQHLLQRVGDAEPLGLAAGRRRRLQLLHTLRRVRVHVVAEAAAQAAPLLRILCHQLIRLAQLGGQLGGRRWVRT